MFIPVCIDDYVLADGGNRRANNQRPTKQKQQIISHNHEYKQDFPRSVVKGQNK